MVVADRYRKPPVIRSDQVDQIAALAFDHQRLALARVRRLVLGRYGKVERRQCRQEQRDAGHAAPSDAVSSIPKATIVCSNVIAIAAASYRHRHSVDDL